MTQAALTLLVVAVALLVGQHYPVLGGLIATFPIKIFAFALGTGVNAQGVWGLVIGSTASAGCAIALWLTLRWGLMIAVVTGLVVWGSMVGVATLARRIF